MYVNLVQWYFQDINKNETPKIEIEETQVFACPVCYEPLMRKGPSGINL